MHTSEKSRRKSAASRDQSPTICDAETAAVVERAVITLLRKEPFYAHMIISLKRHYGDDVPTAAVSATADGATLWVNPNFFCNELREDERVAVIKHEMLHLLFKHPWRDASNMPDQRLRNIAADLVVNQFIAPWKLPNGAIELSSFPSAGLEADQTMEWYYQKLRSWSKDSQKDSELRLSEAETRFNDQGCDSKWGAKGEESHSHHSGVAAEAIVRRLVGNARSKLTSKEWGDIPGGVQRMIEEICAPPKLPWKRLLRLFAGRGTRTTLKTTRLRESTRFPGEPGVRIKRLQKLAVAVDTSASIDDQALAEFFIEIDGLARCGADITLIECDAVIHNISKYKRRHKPQFKGGGGTNFDPVMRWLKENRNEGFGGCIYLTDGEAPKPIIDPQCPVLWVVTPDMATRHGWNNCGT